MASRIISRDFLIQVAAVVVFFGALWFGLFRQLSGEWSVNDQYSYGWFVPFFAALLFWLRWEDRPKPQNITGQRSVVSDQRTNNRELITNNSKAHAIAIGIAIVSLLLLFPLRVFEIGNPDWRPLSWLHTAIVATLTLLYLWNIGGRSWLRHFAFPILFVFVAVPWLTPIEVPIVQGLMRVVAGIASETVTLFGVPARLEGSLIRISNGLVGVNEACSGVRSLQTSLMIGLLFGELKRLSILRRIVLILAAAAIAFVGNCARAFFLVWIAATKNIAAVGQWHDLAGYSIVIAVFVGSLLLASCMGKNSYRLSVNGSPRRSLGEGGLSVIGYRLSVVAVIWLVAIEVAAATWYRAHESHLVATTRWEIQWPQSEPNFHEIKIDDDVRRILRFDEGRAASWTWRASNSKTLTCVLYFFRWNPGSNSALLANLHRPDVCLPAIGWQQTTDAGVKDLSVAASFALPFRRFEFAHRTGNESTQQIAHAFYCLWEDRAVTPDSQQMPTSPSTWTRGERVRTVLEGRRHLGQQVMEFVVQNRGTIDADEIEARFNEFVPRLIKVKNRSDH